MEHRRGRRCSNDLRLRVLAAVDAYGEVYALARVFNVTVSYICKALDRRRKTGVSGCAAKHPSAIGRP